LLNIDASANDAVDDDDAVDGGAAKVTLVWLL
jgi:hypothetical protein